MPRKSTYASLNKKLKTESQFRVKEFHQFLISELPSDISIERLQQYKKQGISLDSKLPDGNTVLNCILRHAPKERLIEIIYFLLDQEKIDVHAVDAQGNTAIHALISRPYLYNPAQLGRALFCSVDANLNKDDAQLFNLVADQYRILLTLLISKGLKINAKNTSGDTPLHIAAKRCNLLTLRLLTESRADPSLTNQSNLTPLAAAAEAELTSTAGVVKLIDYPETKAFLEQTIKRKCR